MRSRVRGALEWLLADRTDPDRRWVIAQFPNLAILLFVALSVAASFVADGGGWGTALYVATRVAILWWALDELLRGVNPFRRLLGASVLGSVLVGLGHQL